MGASQNAGVEFTHRRTISMSHTHYKHTTAWHATAWMQTALTTNKNDECERKHTGRGASGTTVLAHRARGPTVKGRIRLCDDG